MGATRTLSEVESLARLAVHGVPVVDEHVAPDPDAAAEAAEAIGGPVVVKACGERIAHKTERGLVRLGVEGPDAARRAAAEVLGALGPEDGEVQVVVAPMLRATRELIAGVATDASFGPVVMVGIGGVLAEAIGDVAFRLAPVGEIDAEEMLDDLRLQALLGPFRGEPPVDRDALRAVIVGLSALAGEPDVVSADVNPLLVVEGRPVAVDGLVEVRA